LRVNIQGGNYLRENERGHFREITIKTIKRETKTLHMSLRKARNFRIKCDQKREEKTKGK